MPRWRFQNLCIGTLLDKPVACCYTKQKVQREWETAGTADGTVGNAAANEASILEAGGASFP